MPVRHISPSINVIERDASAYVAASPKTMLCLIGEASKGDINEPTAVTSQEDFTNKFGKSIVNSYTRIWEQSYEAVAGYAKYVGDHAVKANGVAYESFIIGQLNEIDY